MMTRSVISWAVVVLLATPAWAEEKAAAGAGASTGLAPAVVNQAWPRTVEAFAKSLASGDLDATQAALTPRAVVRRFEAARGAETWRLAERAVKSTIIGQHAYVHPPLVMAADIAADFKNAAALPEKFKAQYIVDDDSEIKRANTTAVNWVVEQLGVAPGTPVGVIVLWTPNRRRCST
jgi:hypothetical protein